MERWGSKHSIKQIQFLAFNFCPAKATFSPPALYNFRPEQPVVATWVVRHGVDRNSYWAKPICRRTTCPPGLETQHTVNVENVIMDPWRASKAHSSKARMRHAEKCILTVQTEDIRLGPVSPKSFGSTWSFISLLYLNKVKLSDLTRKFAWQWNTGKKTYVCQYNLGKVRRYNRESITVENKTEGQNKRTPPAFNLNPQHKGEVKTQIGTYVPLKGWVCASTKEKGFSLTSCGIKEPIKNQ